MSPRTRCAPWPHRVRGDDPDAGSSLIEFVGGTVILLVPLVYVLLSVFQVQRGSFAAAEAAREAGRAFATAPSTELGLQRAATAARIAFADQGVAGTPRITFTADGAGCHGAVISPTLRPGSRYTVCVAEDVHLPYADRGVLRTVVPATVHVVGSYVLAVDRWRSGRPG
ncbi:MAG: hypothetical protein ACRDTP_07340 [Mycobacteriales bacterium]